MTAVRKDAGEVRVLADGRASAEGCGPGPGGEFRTEPDAEGAASMREVEALLVREDGCVRRTEVVAVEMRVDLAVDGVPWTTAACSPGDLEDYAYGAAFAAGLVGEAGDVAGVDVRFAGGTAAIDVRLRATRTALPQAGGPALPGCLLDAGAAARTAAGAARAYAPLEPAAVWRMSRALLPAQGMHLATGATHAAVFADRSGAPVLMREDVGRHNAVDKLVGALLRAGIDPQDGFAYLSSRCALELVAKLARAGVRIVATVSAPTSAVLDFAEREGIALAAFARDGRFTVYAHPELIAL